MILITHYHFMLQGSLETKEYIIPELLKELNITADKLCVIAALLGNHILASNQLTDIYKQAGIAGSVDKVILIMHS